MEKYEEQLNAAYSCFYKAFERFNRVVWSGSLPRCVIRFYRGRGGRRLAFAQNSCPPQISFNLSRCLYLPEPFIWGVMAHEMTHIWQFSQGRAGGHGKDFHREMLRAGLDEKQGIVLPGTPGNYVFSLNEISPVSLLGALKVIEACSEFSEKEFTTHFFINN